MLVIFFPIATSWVPIPSPAFPAKLASAHISREPSHVTNKDGQQDSHKQGPPGSPRDSYQPQMVLAALLCRMILPLIYCSGHRDTGQASGQGLAAMGLLECHLSSGSVITAAQPVPSLWHFPASISPASGTQGSSGELTASKGHLRADPDPLATF